jgi:hypothetical protein
MRKLSLALAMIFAVSAKAATVVTYYGIGTLWSIPAENPFGVPAADFVYPDDDVMVSWEFWFTLPTTGTGSWTTSGGSTVTIAGVTVNYTGNVNLTVNSGAHATFQAGVLSGDLYPYSGSYHPFPTGSPSDLLEFADPNVYIWVGVSGGSTDYERVHGMDVEEVPDGGATIGLLAISLGCLCSRRRRD